MIESIRGVSIDLTIDIVLCHIMNPQNHYPSQQMIKVRQVQLDLLKTLLDICKTYNLPIWADSGTLLGAIRHKGFIPWDDDIDMVMKRTDYDRLVHISPQAFHDPFFFQTAYSEKAPYPRMHAQLRMNRTAAILPYDIDQDFHQGIFIDIFPLDTIPNDESQIQALIRHRDIVVEKLTMFTYARFSLFHPHNGIKLYHLKKDIKHAGGFLAHFRALEDFYRSYSNVNSHMVSNLVFYRGDRSQMKEEWYDSTIYLPFEGILIPVPIGYDYILTKQYGDYMTPVHAPSAHGEFALLDTEKSFTEHLPMLRRDKRKRIWKERFEKHLKLIK